MKIETAPTRYDRTTIWLHWITVLLVVEQWIGANTIDDFAKGWPRNVARSVHVSFGVLLAFLLVGRIVWRVTRGRVLPPLDPRVLHIASKAMQGILYLLLIGTVVAGLGLIILGGINYFDLVKIPGLDPGDRALRHSVFAVHKWAANFILIVAGLHALAALFHHYVLRDATLRRIL